MKITAEEMKPNSEIREVVEEGLVSDDGKDWNSQKNSDGILKHESPIKKNFSNIFSPTKTIDSKRKSQKNLKDFGESPHNHHHRNKSFS